MSDAQKGKRTKVVFACPTVTEPYPCFVDAMKASVPLLDGLDHQIVFEVGNPYISAARSSMLRKALDAGADMIVFLDHDLSWKPSDLLKLIETSGDVVSGVYRYKRDEEEYMGALVTDANNVPQGRPEDGVLSAFRVPGGFLKITKAAVNKFMAAYPELVYGPQFYPSVDLFNHGAHDRLWYGEDYAFSRRWLATGERLWIVPDLDIDHHSKDQVYKGNFHKYLMKRNGIMPDAPSHRWIEGGEDGITRWSGL
jgi:glycosyltransferase involved in cell wall biosynthesis